MLSDLLREISAICPRQRRRARDERG